MKIQNSLCSSSSSSSIHSTISTQSTTTTTTSTSPCRRCEGLDLLVKAVYHVAGSVIGVPYIQRRVIRRRKPAVRFNQFLICPIDRVQEEDDCIGNNDLDCNGGDGELVVVRKVKKKVKDQDSVSQSLKVKGKGSRRRRRSSKN